MTDLRGVSRMAIDSTTGVADQAEALHNRIACGAADQTPLRTRIKEIATTRVRYWYKRIYVAPRRERWSINHIL